MYLTQECAFVAQWMERKAAEELKRTKRKPRLCFIFEESDKASASYVTQKRRACERVGISSRVRTFAVDPKRPSHFDLLAAITDERNRSDGIIIQEPLPGPIDSIGVRGEISDALGARRDVDGAFFKHGFTHCTAMGIFFLLRFLYGKALTGKPVAVIGRSKAVGLPIAEMLCRNLDMNVTVLHSRSGLQNLNTSCLLPFVVSCTGKPRLVKKVFDSQTHRVYIDVGFGRDKNGKPCGDIDPELAADSLGNFVTPVPGGVGPLTVAALMMNAAFGRSPLELWTELREEQKNFDQN